MGYPMCDMCDEGLSFDIGKEHVCGKSKVRRKINKLEDDKRDAEQKLDKMQNAVLMLIHELPTLSKEKTEVNTSWLHKLWQATEGRWYEAKTAEDFLVRWLATHRILCEAFDVFRTKKGETMLTKLKNLRESCDSAKNVLGYQDSTFDLSPEDLVK